MSNHKLTLGQTKEIKELYQTGKYTQAELGSKFGVGWRVISDVVRRRYWLAKVTPALCHKIRSDRGDDYRKRSRPNMRYLSKAELERWPPT